MPLDFGTQSAIVAELEAVRARIERGWCQGYYGDAAGNVCLLGAIRERKYRYNGLVGHLAAAIEGGMPHDRMWRSPTVMGFNDAPGRTKEEVLALIDRAIERALAPAEGPV